MDRKEYKKYKKLEKKYRKLLIKQARQAVPYDEKPLLEMFTTYIKFLKDYYDEGNNVHGLEVEGHNRAEEITFALNSYNATKLNEDIYCATLERISRNSTATNGQIDRDAVVEAQELYTKNRDINWNNFWNTIRDNIETWWD